MRRQWWCAAAVAGSLAIMQLSGASAQAGTAAPALPTFGEPVFGVVVDPQKIHYDLLPPAVVKACGYSGKGYFDKNQTTWVFAHVRRDHVDYYIVLSENLTQDSDSFGNAMAVRQTGCDIEPVDTLIGGWVPPKGYGDVHTTGVLPGLKAPWVLNDPKVPGNFHYELRSPEEEAQLRDLIRDGYARSVRAWGSEAAFKQQLCGRGDYIDLPVLSEERARVCGK